MLLSTITGRQSVDVKMTQGGALRVFYGYAHRLKDAKAIELHEGEERTGLDIDIPVSSMYSLQGVVTPRRDVQDVQSGRVKLLDPDDKTVLRETVLDADGGFAFENVVKGTYLVQVEGQNASLSTPPGVRYEPLIVPLLVESDIPNLTYALKPAKK